MGNPYLTTSKRAYSGGHFALELDGWDAGWLNAWEGGLAGADVVSEKIGPDQLQHKHLGVPKYEDISLTLGSVIAPHFNDWINQSMTSTGFSRKDGAVVQADYDYNEVLRLEFSQALISEVQLPACDANSKEPAKLVIKLAPEYTRVQRRQGSSISGGGGLDGKTQKRWLSRNFAFKFDHLDVPNVIKVDGITLKQKTMEFPVGAYRDPLKEPTSIEYPNLSITVPESGAGALFDWYDKFVIGGASPNDGNFGEQTASLTWYHENMTDIAGTVKFAGLGLFKLSQSKAEAQGDAIRTVKADMYMESCVFSVNMVK